VRIPGLKKSDVKLFLQGQYAYTRHRPTQKNFPKRTVIAVNINDVYQMDLVDLQKFAEYNDGVKHILTVIDCFTRYAMVVTLKSKKPDEVIDALVKCFKEYGIPLKVFTDKGTEFLNRMVKSFLKELGVQQWYSYNPGKAVQAERFNRTLKERLWVYLTDRNNYRYVDVLDDVVKSYNATIHSSTGFAPAEVGDDDVQTILDRMPHPGIPNKKPAYEVEDKVRVSVEKLTFEKGYEARYSEMIFKIVELRTSGSHYLYRIADLADNGEPGWFYEKELSKVVIDRHERHRIAKIIRERKYKGRLQYLVSWIGYPAAFDSWEFADEVIK